MGIKLENNNGNMSSDDDDVEEDLGLQASFTLNKKKQIISSLIYFCVTLPCVALRCTASGNVIMKMLRQRRR